MKLSIILPARNEEKLIKSAVVDILTQLKKKKYSSEILIIINGCTDNTEKIVDKLSNKFKEVRKLKSRTGYGYALRKGIQKARGNFVIFLGADDTDKIKGLKSVKYPFSRVWIEEFADFKTEEEISKIVNSVFREELGNLDLSYKAIFSYNPPKQKHHWVNKKFETITIPKHYYIMHTTYLDNPHMSKEFLLEAEHTKATNLNKYKWEYLGEAIGSGVVPFSNLIFEEITNENINSFDNIRQGLDWGYSIDPASFMRMYFDKTRRKLYIFGEIYQVKLSNAKLAEMIKNRKWDDTKITADSAEPKSIDNLKKDYGITKIVGAKKGKGSVESGEKWLDELDAIIIDPARCPNTAREFETADYAIDRQGNTLMRIEDKDNHSIDAVRYGMENDMVKRIARRVSGKRTGF